MIQINLKFLDYKSNLVEKYLGHIYIKQLIEKVQTVK